MIDSIVLGLNAFSDEYYIIYPVDFPFVKKGTVDLLIEQTTNKQDVVKPTYLGISGHPILISANIRDSILQNPTLPLSKYLDPKKTSRINCNDKGILKNVNYLKDIRGK